MNYSQKLMQNLLIQNLSQGINKGTLLVTMPNHDTVSFLGKAAGAEAHWHIHDWEVVKSLATRGDIGLGETYAAGLWDADDLDALFRVFIDNLDDLDRLANGSRISQFWFRIINTIFRRNSLRGSSQNIRSHYDVGNDFYRLWLDDTMTYSSALYDNNAIPLETAQKNKYQRILDHIGSARERVLEVGCGWGGFAEHATDAGHQLTGVTISKQQHEFSKKRLGDRTDIRLQDYRHIQGKFDAITSIEMFEAVGQRYWPTYFTKLKDCLAKDGVAMIQTITVQDDAFSGYSKRSDYIRHYVFPGGMLPSIAKFKESTQQAGLICRDVYAFGKDYSKTLKEWLRRFDANEAMIRNLGYSTSFIRSWRLYLNMCAASFACGRTDVIQAELVHA
jgi:cyclopropane-fatty-acyl-phospholipid synthase